MESGAVAGLYQALEAKRAPYIERARESARLTIPALMPPLGKTGARELEVTKQSLGGRGVNNLASTLLLALVPPNAPFFRLQLSPEIEVQIEGEAKTEIEKSLSLWERSVVAEVERSGLRTPMFSGLRQLLVAGNVVIFFRPNGGIRVYHLDTFVLRRDPAGKVTLLIIREQVRLDALKTMLSEEDFARVAESKAGRDAKENDEPIDIYTKVERDGDQFKKVQEIGEVLIEASEETFSEAENPYVAPRMVRIDGEDYGRSFVEELRGDLASFEALQQSGVSGAMAAAKHIIFVDPAGTTRIKDISQAPNLAVRSGKSTDVTVLSMNKVADMQFVERMAMNLQNSLAQSFLLTEGGVRNAERVTAEEIRAVQNSLERQLGGVYSLLSIELQLPLIRHTLLQLQKRGGLPELPEDVIEPVIVTGVQALGRAAESARLDELVVGLQRLLGPDAVARFMNVENLIARKCAALGIDSEGLVKTQEQMAAEAQAAREAAAQDAATQAAIDGGKQVAVDAAAQAQQAA